MRFKRITDSTAHAYLSKVTDADRAYTDDLVRPFDAESITYNTKPNISASTYSRISISRGWNEISTYVTKFGIWYGIAFSFQAIPMVP